MAPTYRARTGEPVPEITISKALRIGAEELGILLKKCYQAICNKLDRCVRRPADDDDDDDNNNDDDAGRQRLIKPQQQTSSTQYGTNAGPGPDSSSRTSRSSSSSRGQDSSNAGSAKTRILQQTTGDDNEDEDEVPPEFQVLSPKTPETPPNWKIQTSKILVNEYWPPSYPGVERTNFGSRFYHNS